MDDPTVWVDQIIRLYREFGQWVLNFAAGLYAFYLLCKHKPWFRDK